MLSVHHILVQGKYTGEIVRFSGKTLTDTTVIRAVHERALCRAQVLL